MPADKCRISADCDMGLHDPSDHPCGRPVEAPGTPCQYCGEPVPMDGSGCPDCWVPATIPLLKAMFAPYGISVDPQISGLEGRGDDH